MDNEDTQPADWGQEIAKVNESGAEKVLPQKGLQSSAAGVRGAAMSAGANGKGLDKRPNPAEEQSSEQAEQAEREVVEELGVAQQQGRTEQVATAAKQLESTKGALAELAVEEEKLAGTKGESKMLAELSKEVVENEAVAKQRELKDELRGTVEKKELAIKAAEQELVEQELADVEKNKLVGAKGVKSKTNTVIAAEQEAPAMVEEMTVTQELFPNIERELPAKVEKKELPDGKEEKDLHEKEVLDGQERVEEEELLVEAKSAADVEEPLVEEIELAALELATMELDAEKLAEELAGGCGGALEEAELSDAETEGVADSEAVSDEGCLVEAGLESAGAEEALDLLTASTTDAEQRSKLPRRDVALTREKEPKSWRDFSCISATVQCPPKKRGRKPKAKAAEGESAEPKAKASASKRGRSTTKSGTSSKRQAAGSERAAPSKKARAVKPGRKRKAAEEAATTRGADPDSAAPAARAKAKAKAAAKAAAKTKAKPAAQKAKQSRKSAAYHREKKIKLASGSSLEEAVRAAREVSWHYQRGLAFLNNARTHTQTHTHTLLRRPRVQKRPLARRDRGARTRTHSLRHIKHWRAIRRKSSATTQNRRVAH